MIYMESYSNLCHGTDEKSAEKIKKEGFIIQGANDSWCGAGVYFYDIKAKAWWAAERKCQEIKKQTEKKVKPKVVFANIADISKQEIFDMRVYQDLIKFEECISGLFDEHIFHIDDDMDETERIILLRKMLISYYADLKHRKLVIGNFRQRPQPQYEHAIAFANNLDMIFGIETIYCVKDTGIITSIH